jgi:hypothetical protein
MSRRTWKKDGLYITYGNPSIQPFREDLLSSMKGAMYFYYDIDIFDGKKQIFHAEAFDFPKVQNLPNYIDHIVNMEEEEMFVYENFENNGFHRRKLYNFITLEDSFNMDSEYFYKIERMVTYVKQREEEKPKRYEDYTLTIGKCEPNKKGYSDGEPYGKQIFFKYLTKYDLLELKQTAIDFCNIAIEYHNRELRKYKIKCPKCGEHQLLLGSLIKEDEFGNQSFKCSKCAKEFSDNDDIYI